MNMRFVVSQIIRTSYAPKLAVGMTAVFVMLFAAGCGKRFEANSDSYHSAPPATSDPLTAEDQRRWDAANENRLEVAPVLESDLEVESFMGDLTEKAPAHTDDELAEEAERLHQQRRRSRGASKPDQEKTPKQPRRGRGAEREAQDPRETSTLEPGASSSSSAPSSPSSSPSATRPPAPSSGSTTPRTSGSTTPRTSGSGTAPIPPPAKTSAGPRSPVPSQPQDTRPARPAATIGSKFCESLNVTGNGNTDLSHLYNNPATENIVMPSKELAEASTPEKKNRFVCLLLPAAIRMDEEVYRMRLEVLRLQAKQKKSIELEEDEKKWFEKMVVEYRVPTTSSTTVSAKFEELLKRVEVVPLALLLSQAAVESGWGTSRATKNLNNIFGIHAVGNEPYKLGYDWGSARMRVFPSIDASISAYIRLLNTGTAYNDFRTERARMRKQQQPLDNVELMKKLVRYSERGQNYIKEVIEIMTKFNNLTQFVFKEEEVSPVKL